MDYEKLKKERISSTKIKPYHLITAVTQRAINAQLAKMYKVNKSLQKLELKSQDPNDDYSCLYGDLDPPTIELRLGTENRNVIFCLNIRRAKMKYFQIKGRKVIDKEIELPSCVLALSVNLGMETVDFESLPNDVKQRLRVLNNYTVKQMYVQFTSGALARLDKRRTTIQDHISDLIARVAFNTFIETYFVAVNNNRDCVVSYHPVADSGVRKNYPMPTIPPSTLTYMNIPFVASDSDEGKPSDDNMLVYLQMTGNAVPPRELLPVSANWVVPTPDNAGRYDGTVALSREIFLEGWLIPKLTEFNKRSSWVVTTAWWKQTGVSVEYSLYGHLGRDATEEELKFKPVERSQVALSVLMTIGATRPGQWYQYYFYSSKDDDKGMWRVWMTGTTDNYLFIPEGYNKDGKCEIILIGSTFINFYVHIDLPKSTGYVNGAWKTSIILDGINDGELVIKIDDITPVITTKIDEAILRKGEITYFSEPAKQGLNDLRMAYLLEEIRNVFGGGWQFVLPGGGDFYISKAVFNKEEDLLCELKYKMQA